MYNKQGLLDLAKGLIKHDIRLLASGGTAKRKSFSKQLITSSALWLVCKKIEVLALCLPPGPFVQLMSYYGTVSLILERKVIREAGFEVE